MSPLARTPGSTHRRRVAALRLATRSLAGIDDFPATAECIAEACRAALGAKAACVALRLPSDAFAVVVRTPGPFAAAALDVGSASGAAAQLRRLAERAVRSGHAVAAADLGARRTRGAAPPSERAPRTRRGGALLAPIVVAGEVAGLLGVAGKRGSFDVADRRLAELFADLAAVALGSSHAVRGHERSRDALESEVRRGATDLGEAEGKLRTLIENLPDVVARYDPRLRHLYVSPAVERVTGRKATEFIGRTLREVGMPVGLVDLWDAALGRVFRSGVPESLEFEFASPEGLRHFDCKLVPEAGPGGATSTVLTVARDVTPLWLATVRLQALARRLVEVQEDERRHIARELHDEAGQTLAALRFGLRLLEREIEAGGSGAGRLAELMAATDAVIDGLHRLAADLRPASLDHLGLEAALRQYAHTAAARYGVAVRFKARGFTDERLSAEVETSLYRVVQEAVTNVVKHARASRIDILAERRGERVRVMVEDDGVGFAADDRHTDRVHLGLLGMKERAEALGGTLTIESARGAGTTIVVEVASVDSRSDR